MKWKTLMKGYVAGEKGEINMDLEELYKEYGRLNIQAEILGGKIQEIKGKIAQELQKAQSIKKKPIEQ